MQKGRKEPYFVSRVSYRTTIICLKGLRFKTIGNGDKDAKCPIALGDSPETALQIFQAKAFRRGSSLGSEAWCEISDSGKYANHCRYNSIYVEIDVV